MYGLALIPMGIVLSNITVYALGWGLFVDELGYLLIGGKTHQDNYSRASLFLVVIFIILTFIFRELLLLLV